MFKNLKHLKYFKINLHIIVTSITKSLMKLFILLQSIKTIWNVTKKNDLAVDNHLNVIHLDLI